jgi:hypothetical protein
MRWFLLGILLVTTTASAQEPCLTDTTFGRASSRVPRGTEFTQITIQRPDMTTEQIMVPKTAAAVLNNTWDRGQTLRIQFVDPKPDPVTVNRVVEHIRTWEKYVNLRFLIVTPNNPPGDFPPAAHIRISFQDRGHYSYIGRASMDPEVLNKPSMNLAIDRDTNEETVRRVVLHEFGHALGFAHEHQNPKGGIQWKQPDAMNYFKRTTGWDEEKIRSNIFERLNAADITASEFDRDSIMLYEIPPGLTRDGFSVGWNTRLSSTDISAASAIYPTLPDRVFGVRYKISPGFLPSGILLGAIHPASPLADLREFGNPGLQGIAEPGDILRSINGKPVATIADFEQEAAKVTGPFIIRLWDVRLKKDRDWVGEKP